MSVRKFKPESYSAERLGELNAERIKLFPPAESNGISMHPQICSGQPCVSKSRIPTGILAGRYAAGESIESIADDYHLPSEDIEAAIRFELLRRITPAWWKEFGYTEDPTTFWKRHGFRI